MKSQWFFNDFHEKTSKSVEASTWRKNVPGWFGRIWEVRFEKPLFFQCFLICGILNENNLHLPIYLYIYTSKTPGALRRPQLASYVSNHPTWHAPHPQPSTEGNHLDRGSNPRPPAQQSGHSTTTLPQHPSCTYTEALPRAAPQNFEFHLKHNFEPIPSKSWNSREKKTIRERIISNDLIKCLLRKSN